MLWLAAISAGMVAVAAIFLALGSRPEGEDDALPYAESFWTTLNMALAPGAVEDPGWPYRLVMLAVAILGVLIVSTIIGVLTAGIEGKLDDLRRGLAETYAASGQPHDALTEFDYLVTHSSDDVRGVNLCSRARFHEDQGRPTAALADYEAARTDTPNLFDAWLGEARTAHALGDAAAANRAIEMCRQLQPGDPRIEAVGLTGSQ